MKQLFIFIPEVLPNGYLYTGTTGPLTDFCYVTDVSVKSFIGMHDKDVRELELESIDNHLAASLLVVAVCQEPDAEDLLRRYPEKAIACRIKSLTATQFTGEHFRLIAFVAPPATGKSTIANAFSKAGKVTHFVDAIADATCKKAIAALGSTSSRHIGKPLMITSNDSRLIKFLDKEFGGAIAVYDLCPFTIQEGVIEGGSGQ